ncbi:PucR family transcriptional regulator [Nocardia macrotermitis]|uniref:PucR C-terminal helix-turn-helix domain-containing protein n=1 Tax=Nocardia macrotermitis TaxID=2585198 RepID=A0A7K0D3B8_9NOCA|nr:helix-turn-helix domain-containing protein [Nocardia macrotermitis]MQY20157.1 hypothetical protein [Nocardia macrotermitis]
MSTRAVSGGSAAERAVSGAFRELIECLRCGDGISAAIRQLEAAATGWAATGVTLRAFNAELQASLTEAVRGVVRSAALTGDAESVVEIIISATAVVADIHHRIWCDGRLGEMQSLAGALLSGENPLRLSRESGIAVAGSYWVVALSVPPGAAPAAEPVLRRIRIELAERYGDRVLPRLSAAGGTILVPAIDAADPPASLVSELSAAAQVPVTAAGVWAARPDIPAAARQAHDLLELALLFGRTGRWHTFADLALEYQLTRPGSSREHLAALLDPLSSHPHLAETLRLHLRGDLSRRRISQMLNIHTNTLDYRLKRIGRLTGVDPFSSDGQWYLRAALVAHTVLSSPVAAQRIPKPATQHLPKSAAPRLAESAPQHLVEAADDQSARATTPRSVVSRR